MDELLVPVRGGRGRRHEAVRHLVEQLEERLVGLRAEASENARLVQGDGLELVGVEPAVADALVVREVDAVAAELACPPDELHLHAQKPRVALELLAHAQRADDEGAPSLASLDEPHDLQLHHRLAQAERGEDGAPPAHDRPAHDVALEREERVAHVVARVEARMRDVGSLALKELPVIHLFS